MNIWHYGHTPMDFTMTEHTATILSLAQKQERTTSMHLCEEGFYIQDGPHTRHVIHCATRDSAIDTMLDGHKLAQVYWDNGVMA